MAEVRATAADARVRANAGADVYTYTYYTSRFWDEKVDWNFPKMFF